MNREWTGRFLRRLTALALALCCAVCFGAVAEQSVSYVENEYNYVDGSMDLSHGLPDVVSGVLDRIRRTGVLRVATEPYFAPQEFIDPDLEGQDQYVGADMEMARMIADRLGVALEIVPMEFTEVLTSVSEDQCDLAISALSFTPSRAATNTMSKGYYFSGEGTNVGIVIRAENLEKITTIEDLSDKIIIAQSGSLQEALIGEQVRAYHEFRRVSTVQTVYDAVSTGKADAGGVDITSAAAYIRNNPQSGLALVEGIQFNLEETYQGDRIAAKKGELQLMYFVNAVIDEILEKDLYNRWIDQYSVRAAELGM